MSESRKRASSEQEENTTRKIPRNIGGKYLPSMFISSYFLFLRFDFISAGGVHLKILIPSNLAGVVLGKGGESIIRIQEESNIKAHMSKANEFFPGKHSHKLSNLVISLLREFNVVFRFQVQTNVFALYRQPKPVTSRKVYK